MSSAARPEVTIALIPPHCPPARYRGWGLGAGGSDRTLVLHTSLESLTITSGPADSAGLDSELRAALRSAWEFWTCYSVNGVVLSKLLNSAIRLPNLINGMITHMEYGGTVIDLGSEVPTPL